MTAVRVRIVAVGLVVSAVLAAACPVRGEETFTPVAAGVRYRKIGTYDKARLAAILDGGLDTFLAGFDPSQASTMKSSDFDIQRQTRCSLGGMWWSWQRFHVSMV